MNWIGWLFSILGILIGVYVGHCLTKKSLQEERAISQKEYLNKCACSIYAEISENINIASENENNGAFLQTIYVTECWDIWKGELFNILLSEGHSIFKTVLTAYIQMKRANSLIERSSGHTKQDTLL